MAELGHNYNIQCMKLMYELKAAFPVIPDDIVRQCMKKHHNDKEKCIEELAEEAENSNIGRVQAARNRNQALLSHQLEQLLKLESEIRHDKDCLHTMRQEVCDLEARCESQAMKNIGQAHKFTLMDLQDLQQDINHLRNECDSMSNKVTQLTSGRVLLGDVSITSNIILKPKLTTAVPDQTNTTCDTTNVSSPDTSLPPTNSSTSCSISSGLTGSSGEAEGGKWSCETCTFHNHPALDCCEVCLMPRIEMDIVPIHLR